MIKCNWIPVSKGQDKICHFLIGATIAIIVTLLSEPLYGVIAGVVVGLIKELYDHYTYDLFDFFDLFATVAGAVIGVMALHLLLIWI